MKKVAVIIAEGTEELECLTPVDVLRRADVKVDIISVGERIPVLSHGVSIVADCTYNEADFSEYDAFVVPGGMLGAENISNNKKVINALKEALEQGKLVASICASPAVVLAENGLLGDYKATCYPAERFIKALNGNYTGANVEKCKNLITANGPKSSLEFSLAICDYLQAVPKF